jgi:hypothetical protein
MHQEADRAQARDVLAFGFPRPHGGAHGGNRLE